MLINIFIYLSILTNQYQSGLFPQLLGHIPDNAVHLLECAIQRHHTERHNTILQLSIYLVQLAGCLLEIIQFKACQIWILYHHSLGNNQLANQIHQPIQLVHPNANHLTAFPMMYWLVAALGWHRCWPRGLAWQSGSRRISGICLLLCFIFRSSWQLRLDRICIL